MVKASPARSGIQADYPLAGSTLRFPGDVITGQTTVSTATECVQITTETFSARGIRLEVVDSATFYVASGSNAGDNLSSRGIVVKANNGIFIETSNPSTLFVDSAGSSKTISWCVM